MVSLHKIGASNTLAETAANLTLEERVDAIAHRVEYRRMVDFEDREAIYHLRRKAHSKKNANIEEWAAEAVDDPHEDNSATIGLFIDGRLVGSVKVTVATQAYPNCQSRGFAPDLVDALLDKGGVYIDPGRLVADPAATREFSELPYLLIKIPMLACQYFEAHSCFSLVAANHAPFYRRVFRSKMISGPIWYEPLQADVLLMCGSVDDVRASILKRFPFWKANYLEMRQMFGSFDEWKCIEQSSCIAA
ncbi:MAG: hypothetical protein GKR97_15995 [Rhizobiaceae bacterium]|nr:hypothetical protein [Rhizobiaceae bacterium]